MLSTLFLAKFFGLYMAIMGLVVLLRPEHMSKMLADWQNNPTAMFLGGIFTLMFGIFLILTHTSWELWLSFFISLISWMTFFKGVMLVTFPEVNISFGQKIFDNETARRIWSVLAILIGGLLIWAGFSG